MCSYKVVNASFEVWGFQTRVEEFIHRSIREVLLLGHRQAFVWIDDWFNMTIEDVRAFERQQQEETNKKLKVEDTIDSVPTEESLTRLEDSNNSDISLIANTMSEKIN